MKFNYLDEFEKDLKKLKKKIPSLEGDLENFKRFVALVDFDNNKRFKTLKTGGNFRIIKTRLMVRSLKGANKTRLVFSFCKREDTIDFIEIYLKNQKSREDFDRIEQYINLL